MGYTVKADGRFKKGFVPWNKGKTVWYKGRKLSEEHKKRIGEANKGKNHGRGFQTIESREKISQSLMGHGFTEKTKKKISESVKANPNRYWKGKKRDPKVIEAMISKIRGVPLSMERREKMSIKSRGSLSSRWQGGKTSENHVIRRSLQYRLWRESVFERDNWTCIWCGVRGGSLEADHIKPFCDYPELRFAIDNGRTLCKECHKKIGWRRTKNDN